MMEVQIKIKFVCEDIRLIESEKTRIKKWSYLFWAGRTLSVYIILERNWAALIHLCFCRLVVFLTIFPPWRYSVRAKRKYVHWNHSTLIRVSVSLRRTSVNSQSERESRLVQEKFGTLVLPHKIWSLLIERRFAAWHGSIWLQRRVLYPVRLSCVSSGFSTRPTSQRNIGVVELCFGANCRG